MCHPVCLELVKDPAVLLIWSGLGPSTAHQFYLIYIPEPTLYFCVRNQWEKDPYQAPLITRKKQESPKNILMDIMHSVNIFSACLIVREFF